MCETELILLAVFAVTGVILGAVIMGFFKTYRKIRAEPATG